MADRKTSLTLAGEELITSLQQFALLLFDDSHGVPRLADFHALGPGQAHRAEPKLGRANALIGVNVRRFRAFLGEEVTGKLVDGMMAGGRATKLLRPPAP